MSKTCGECKHFYPSDEGQCSLKDDWGFTDNDACPDFKSQIVTNGDKIRQMSNADLAEMLVYPVKPMNVNGNIYYEFTSCLLLGKSYPMREQAVFLTERRLNAPAESEGGRMSKKCGECANFDRSLSKCNKIQDDSIRENDTVICCPFYELRQPTVFDRITQSPEVLAEAFVEDTMDGTMFYSILTRDDYWTKENAIAATVEKLKEIEK